MTTVRTKAEADQVRARAYNMLGELRHELAALKEQIKRDTKKQRARVKEIGLLIEQLCYVQIDTIHALQYSAIHAKEQAEKETPCEAPEQPMIPHKPTMAEWTTGHLPVRITFEKTGECRPPERGEYFEYGEVILKASVNFPLDSPRNILRKL